LTFQPGPLQRLCDSGLKLRLKDIEFEDENIECDGEFVPEEVDGVCVYENSDANKVCTFYQDSQVAGEAVFQFYRFSRNSRSRRRYSYTGRLRKGPFKAHLPAKQFAFSRPESHEPDAEFTLHDDEEQLLPYWEMDDPDVSDRTWRIYNYGLNSFRLGYRDATGTGTGTGSFTQVARATDDDNGCDGDSSFEDCSMPPKNDWKCGAGGACTEQATIGTITELSDKSSDLGLGADKVGERTFNLSGLDDDCDGHYTPDVVDGLWPVYQNANTECTFYQDGPSSYRFGRNSRSRRRYSYRGGLSLSKCSCEKSDSFFACYKKCGPGDVTWTFPENAGLTEDPSMSMTAW